MRDPVVSIIVPNYNHGPFLPARLNSIFHQTFQDFEVILLDDQSTDNSAEILQQHARHQKVTHFVINESNSGSPFRQWKKGVELAKGDFIWIAESDDFCTNDFLKVILSFFDKNKNVGLVYTQSVDIDEQGIPLSNRINWTADFQVNIWKNDFCLSGKKFVQDYLMKKNVIPNASAVVFKKVLVKETVFTEEMLGMKMCGDWFFWLNLCFSSEVGFISQSLNFFRKHSSSSRNHLSNYLRCRRLLEERDVRKQLLLLNLNSQKKETEALYTKWIYLHSKHSILNENLFRILIKRSHIIQFIFLWFKIRFYER